MSNLFSPTTAERVAQQVAAYRTTVGRPQGLLTAGNLNLNARPRVVNPDGSISTVRSITITDNKGRATLIPTVIGNSVVPNDSAIQHYQKTGENLGTFRNERLADAYAQTLHLAQAKQYLANLGHS